MYQYRYKNLTVNANSIGGVETCYIFPKYNIGMDFGKCPEELIKVDTIFLTHAHLDHAAGLPYYISQRILRNMPPYKIYVPASALKKLKKIVKLWQDLEKYSHDINIIPIETNQKVKINDNTYVQALKSYHRVQTNGYAIIEKRVKLKKEYLKLPSKKIKALKVKNKDIFEIREIPIFAFSGDSIIEFVKNNEIAQKAEVLFIECTYIDQKRTIKQAREWGHTHLDEIVLNKHLFQNKKIVLVHFSPRYSINKIKFMLDKKIPESISENIEFIPNHYNFY